jgi:hypothetical protein
MTTTLAAIFFLTVTLFGLFWTSIDGFAAASATRSHATSRK